MKIDGVAPSINTSPSVISDVEEDKLDHKFYDNTRPHMVTVQHMRIPEAQIEIRAKKLTTKISH